MKRPETNGLDEAFARTADGTFAIGPDGRIALWNRAAEKMLGYSAREAIGRPCRDLFVGYDDSGNRLCYQGCHVMSLVKMGDPGQSFDMRTRTTAGRHLGEPQHAHGTARAIRRPHRPPVPCTATKIASLEPY